MTTKDFMVSGEEFKLVKAGELLITEPRPENLEAYYESGDYISHTDSREGFTSYLYQTVKRFTLSRKVNLLKRYAGNDKTLLDVGAGTGDLLEVAARKGFKVYGTEPNAAARDKAATKGISLKETFEFDRQFKLISLWHVLEHLRDPDEMITKIKSVLEDDGTLFVAVPNFRSYDAVYYKEYWAAYDVPRHLWHFSRQSMSQLFNKHQMKIVDIKAMPFDSFYVSLLSEKYRTGKPRMFKAFTIGALSNFKAMRSGEYSSLLYIIQKA